MRRDERGNREKRLEMHIKALITNTIEKMLMR
jgi:hypothetical protein